jgi:hypothetical protein
VKLTWSITQSAGLFTYSYTWSKPDGSGLTGQPSHLLLEVSENYTSANTHSSSANFSSITAPQTFVPSGANNPNPYLPASIFGIKLDYAADTYTLVTDRVPVWGDIYAKDGKQGSFNFDAAWNSGFGTNPTASTTNFTQWVPTPDTITQVVNIVPLPPAAWAGMALMVVAGVISYRRN